MSTLEQPFIDAIVAKEIEGVILAGRDASANIYLNAFGERTLLDGTKRPFSTSDIIFLASATKLLTTIAALQCCEQGKLNLDADLREQLLDLCNQGVLLHYDDNSPATEPIRNALTLRHLLTHSAGLVYDLFPAEVGGSILDWRAANPVPKGPADVPLRYTQPLVFQPGEGWIYGPSIDWIGSLVEQATGKQLDEYFRTFILQPLRISPSEFSFFPVHEGLGDRMADVNPKDPRGEGLMAGTGHSVHGPDGVKACFGGQGGYGTAEAYIEILHSLLLNDGKLLEKETVQLMFQPHLDPAARKYMASVFQTPFGSFLNQATSGKDCDFGLGGLFVGNDESEAGLGKGSLVWGGGINTIWHIDRTNGVCGFASMQLGLPVNFAKAMELKPGFRRGLKDHLRSVASL